MRGCYERRGLDYEYEFGDPVGGAGYDAVDGGDALFSMAVGVGKNVTQASRLCFGGVRDGAAVDLVVSVLAGDSGYVQVGVFAGTVVGDRGGGSLSVGMLCG